MAGSDLSRWAAGALALGLVILIASQAPDSDRSSSLLESSATDDADTKSGSFEKDIMALAWHPKHKQAVATKKQAHVASKKVQIPGLAPWAKALLDTAAKEQIREVDRHARSVAMQQAIVAKEKKEKALAMQREEEFKKLQMSKELKALRSKISKSSLKGAATPKSSKAALAHARIQAKKAAASAPMSPELRKINAKKESRFAAYAEVKSFFREQEQDLQAQKKQAILLVQKEAAAGKAKIDADLKTDVKKIDQEAQQHATDLYREEAGEEAFLRRRGLRAVQNLVAAGAAAKSADPAAAVREARQAEALDADLAAEQRDKAAAAAAKVAEEKKEEKLKEERKWWNEHGARKAPTVDKEGLRRLEARHAQLRAARAA